MIFISLFIIVLTWFLFFADMQCALHCADRRQVHERTDQGGGKFYSNTSGFRRAMRFLAASTRLFRLVNTQNRALRARPLELRWAFHYIISARRDLMIKRENPRKILLRTKSANQ